MMNNSKTAKAKLGDHVRIEYSGQYKDEKSSVQRLGRELLDFVVGSREVMPGINKGVVGMVEGERKQMTLIPQDAFGVFRSNLIREIPRTRLPSDVVLKVGKRLTTIGVKSGRRSKVRILELTPTTVVVDGNHPLAGKTVDVEFQLLVHDSAATST
ncbi:MAG: peptidylprolyl isomerase [Planctomycetaceae bacterium]